MSRPRFCVSLLQTKAHSTKLEPSLRPSSLITELKLVGWLRHEGRSFECVPNLIQRHSKFGLAFFPLQAYIT